MSEPTVRASVLVALPGYLRARGADLTPLLVQAGLDPAVLDDRNRIISLNATAKLFDLVAERLSDPAFGLSYALAFPIGGSGLLGHLMMSAPNVRCLLKVMAHYMEIHTTPMRPTFEEHATVGWFAFTWPATFTAPLQHYTIFAVGCLVLRLRLGAGQAWHPLVAEFQHRAPTAPEALEAYAQLFGSRIKFDQPRNSIALDQTALSKPLPTTMEGLFDTIQELGDQKLKARQAEPDDDAAALHRLLNRLLQAEEPFDLETCAAALGMTGRSLQWRLEQEGTSYEQVLVMTRIVAAERYLRDSDHQLTRIASLLGFSELSAFTRWSRSRFKMTPSAYRQCLRAGGTSGFVSAPE